MLATGTGFLAFLANKKRQGSGGLHRLRCSAFGELSDLGESLGKLMNDDEQTTIGRMHWLRTSLCLLLFLCPKKLSTGGENELKSSVFNVFIGPTFWGL